jgi:hypothetical protein
MGYGMHFPAHQVGGQLELWDIRGYGLSRVWVMTGPTVYIFILTTYLVNNILGKIYVPSKYSQNILTSVF